MGPLEFAQSSTDVGEINVEFVFKEAISVDISGQPVNPVYRQVTTTERPPRRTSAISGNITLDRHGVGFNLGIGQNFRTRGRFNF